MAITTAKGSEVTAANCIGRELVRWLKTNSVSPASLKGNSAVMLSSFGFQSPQSLAVAVE